MNSTIWTRPSCSSETPRPLSVRSSRSCLQVRIKVTLDLFPNHLDETHRVGQRNGLDICSCSFFSFSINSGRVITLPFQRALICPDFLSPLRPRVIPGSVLKHRAHFQL